MISSWSLLGYLAALCYSIVTIRQYWITYPDTSQFLMNMAIAFLVAGVSWLYNKQLQQGNTLLAIEDYLDDKKEVTENE